MANAIYWYKKNLCVNTMLKIITAWNYFKDYKGLS